MTRMKQYIAISAWSTLATLFMCGPTTHAQSVNVPLLCESQRLAAVNCDLTEPVSNVRLARIFSDAPCNISNVAFNPTGITVTNGCRALFNVTLATTRQVAEVSCSSDNFQPRTCVAQAARDAGSTVHAVWAVERQSRNSCQIGQQVFIEGDSITVTGGCRGRFFYTVE
jgi:hypothetical protein